MNKEWKGFAIFIGILLIAIFLVWSWASPSENQINNKEINENNNSGEVLQEDLVSTDISEVNPINNSEDYTNPSENDIFSNTNETHWNHMPLTYNFYNCFQTDINRIIKATDFITNRTGSITFKFENIETPDISFICMSEREIEHSNRYSTETFGEAVPYVYADYPNIYASSEILIFPVTTCPYARPVTEIHEILHLLGLQHPNYAYEDDIMNAEHVGCNTDITEDELKYLKNIYG